MKRVRKSDLNGKPCFCCKAIQGQGMSPLLWLKKLWEFEINRKNKPIRGLAFSDNGLLGIASSDRCAYILDKNGKLITKQCGGYGMEDVSFCCSKFGFVNWDDYAYIYDLSTGTWKNVYVEDNYHKAITMLRDGFLAGSWNIAYFGFRGYKRWDVSIRRIWNGPAVYKGYVYVPRYDWPFGGNGALTILRLSDGSEVRTINFGENVWDAQFCGYYLALGTANHVYLYDISDPTNPIELWNFNGIARSGPGSYAFGAYNVAFSLGCKYLVSADFEDQKIHLFDVQTGRQLLEKKFEYYVSSVAWWKDRIAVGFSNDNVYMFKVSFIFPTSKTKISVRDLLFKNKQIEQFEVE